MPSINLGRVGIVNKGDYKGGSTQYKVNDICKYNGSVYICIQAHNVEHTPTDTNYWTVWFDFEYIKNALALKVNNVLNSNSFIIASDHTILPNMSATTISDSDGVVTINGGVTVTISPKSKWVIM